MISDRFKLNSAFEITEVLWNGVVNYFWVIIFILCQDASFRVSGSKQKFHCVREQAGWPHHYGGDLPLDLTPQQPLHFFLQLPSGRQIFMDTQKLCFLSFFFCFTITVLWRKSFLHWKNFLRVDTNLPNTNIYIYMEVVRYCKKNNTCNTLYTLFISEGKKRDITIPGVFILDHFHDKRYLSINLSY